MPKLRYITKNFTAKSLEIIERANAIIAEYASQGLILTLRQLYYQFVSKGWLPNLPKSYDNLGALITDARMAGLVDWEGIEDRTRNLISNSHWTSPADIIRSAAYGYHIDRWKDQPNHAEVWIEKEALAGVLQSPCSDLDVSFFACRGYTSASEMWRAGMRLKNKVKAGKKVTIFHFGDHDPSGIDMTRDIRDRLELFLGLPGHDQHRFKVQRVALTMEQVRQYNPPPNPAKTTDARFADYQQRFGDESWELDALPPATLVALVRSAVEGVLDRRLWNTAIEREDREKLELQKVSDRWPRIVEAINEE